MKLNVGLLFLRASFSLINTYFEVTDALWETPILEKLILFHSRTFTNFLLLAVISKITAKSLMLRCRCLFTMPIFLHDIVVACHGAEYPDSRKINSFPDSRKINSFPDSRKIKSYWGPPNWGPNLRATIRNHNDNAGEDDGFSRGEVGQIF